MESQICERPSSAGMPAKVPCSVFLCRTCHAPIKLPDEALKQRFLGLTAQLGNDFPVALVCIVCKRVDIFSSQPGSPYYDPNWRHISSFRDGKTEWLSTLLCKGEENEFRVPLLITWTTDFTVHEKMDRATTWHGNNMLCPVGHPIFWPWSR
jgi:hypothetical protein